MTAWFPYRHGKCVKLERIRYGEVYTNKHVFILFIPYLMLDNFNSVHKAVRVVCVRYTTLYLNSIWNQFLSFLVQLHNNRNRHDVLLHTHMVYLKIGFAHFQQIWYKELIHRPYAQNYKSDDVGIRYCNVSSTKKWQFVIQVKIKHLSNRSLDCVFFTSYDNFCWNAAPPQILKKIFCEREKTKTKDWYAAKCKGTNINLLNPSGNFTYHQV
jgi:hypothetical protein